MAPGMKWYGPRGRGRGKIQAERWEGRDGMGLDSERHRGAAIHIFLLPCGTPTAAIILFLRQPSLELRNRRSELFGMNRAGAVPLSQRL